MAQQVSKATPTDDFINHSLGRMERKGLLTGFDPMGHRPAGQYTRFEIAAATFVAYSSIKRVVLDLQSRLSELSQPGGTEVESCRLELIAVRDKIANLRHLEEDVLDLLRLVRIVGEELSDLGADPFALERDLMDLVPRGLPLFRPDDAARCCSSQRQTKAQLECSQGTMCVQ
jgi:hypothetical protein